MSGFCECGCGNKTTIPESTDRCAGRVKGIPMRFISGHNAKSKWPNWTIKENGCWLWNGARGNVGYGKVWVFGKTVGAHRFVYEKIRGPIPKGKHLDHLCRNSMCVNPSHLEPVTVAENKRRGLGMKLSGEDVRTITKLLISGVKQARICESFNISPAHAHRIKYGERWADIVAQERIL